MKKRQIVQIATALGLTALSLFLALRGINFQQVGQALQEVNWGWLIVTVILIIGTLFIRAERWRILLGRKLSLKDAFGLISIGYLISGILPLRAGDPARGVGASLRGPVSVIAALSTVVVERVLDMFIIVIILLSTLPFVTGLQDYLANGMLNERISFELLLAISGGLAFVMLITFILLALFPHKVEELVRRVLVGLHIPNPERWLKPVQNVLEGLTALSSPKEGLLIALWSLILWITTSTYFVTAMQACKSFMPAGQFPLKGTVTTWSSAFGMVFPATGGIGSFHFAVREALFWGFNIPRDLGFAYAVVVHALPYLTGVIIGGITLMAWGISLKRLINSAQAAKDRAAAKDQAAAKDKPQ